ncbi:MAG: lysine decarboxylase [Alphaproteobacteria bacterium]|nr:lysine decarboxylase [Alphaproteobacteria bacterium]
MQRDTTHRVRAPIGVIGPRSATDEQLAIAEEIGVGLADMGLAVVCGGRQGIMEAVCRGVARHDGIAIGLLPETNADAANPFVTISLATGIGEARNALVARAALCLVAIGDSYGTLSEVALGLQFGKRVFGLAGAARVDGVNHVDTAAAALDSVAAVVLGV